RIKEVELWDLVSALGRVLRHQHIDEETSIKYDDTPVAVYVEQLGERVRREGMVTFTSLFESETLRSRIVGLFLAILELLRHHHFRAEQPDDYGEIFIRPPDEETASPEKV
ncbi:MAG: chromosome segregation protein ScpA, partial [Planctomycetaceae bacterium]|nr:chromosome segregation protein ScpA [Planctomycetaceae bacterium]